MNPKTTYLQNVHHYNYEDLQIEVELSRFAEDGRDGLKAEAEIRTSRSPAPGLLFQGRINLSSSRSRSDVIKQIQSRDGEGFLADVDIGGMVQQFCYRSLQQWRQGEPSIILADAPLEPTRYMLYPLVQEKALNMIYGDGGVSKSLLGLAVAVSIATGRRVLRDVPLCSGPVLYMDWEDEASTHRERMDAICQAVGCAVPRTLYYRRMTQSMKEAVNAVRMDVASKGIIFAVVDSIGLAGGDAPEQADTKIPLFTGLRSLGITTLSIDHIAKGDAKRPFGSVYTRNSVRLAWEVQKAQSAGEDTITVSLRNEKINRGRLHERQGYAIRFENVAEEVGGTRLAKVSFQEADVALTDLITTLDAIDQIEVYLRDNGPKSRKDIVKGTGLKDSTVGQTFQRHKGKRLILAASGDYWSLPNDQ